MSQPKSISKNFDPDNIADVQGEVDHRSIKINEVGIRDIRHPLAFRDRSEQTQHTVANISMSVALAADKRGTHMSRFIEMLNEGQPDGVVTTTTFRSTLRQMVDRLAANAGNIKITFPWFVNKQAPVTGVPSLMDYQVTLKGEISPGHQSSPESRSSMWVCVDVPVTSLCPCSKEISEYGAHNQRSVVSIAVRSEGIFWVEELIDLVESQASSQLYGVLKREDEKYVTEHAYDNPKFVEDMARDLAGELMGDARVDAFELEVENFESIHNHSAFARISHDKQA